MSITTLILGESGTGKSSSMMNLDPAQVALIQIVKKPLPFRPQGWQVAAENQQGSLKAIGFNRINTSWRVFTKPQNLFQAAHTAGQPEKRCGRRRAGFGVWAWCWGIGFQAAFWNIGMRQPEMKFGEAQMALAVLRLMFLMD